MDLPRELKEAAAEFLSYRDIVAWVEMRAGLETTWGQSYLVLTDEIFGCISRSSFSTPWEFVKLDISKSPWIEDYEFEQHLHLDGIDGQKFRVKLYSLEKEQLDNLISVMKATVDVHHIAPEIPVSEKNVVSSFENQVSEIEGKKKTIPDVVVEKKSTGGLPVENAYVISETFEESDEDDELNRISRKVRNFVEKEVTSFVDNSHSVEDGTELSPYDLTQLDSLKTLGKLSAGKNDFKKAIYYYESALSLTPEDSVLVDSILEIYKAEFSWSDALDFLWKWAQKVPEGPVRDLYCNKGIITARANARDEQRAMDFVELMENPHSSTRL
ncbi:MAG: tetratricopeptide repeat protein [Deltaproteobacteria bacterium]|nr:tetratricopeptide repeat protein [Deltaproteobacteria bacterium]